MAVLKLMFLVTVATEAGSVALGQTQPEHAKFDVASVRLARDQSPNGYTHQVTASGLTMHGVSMGYCIRFAYGLSAQRAYELVGPDWIDPPTDFIYDISAKAAGPVSPDQIKLMMQSLLVERFGLAVHHETRSLPAYPLVTRRKLLMRRSDPKGEMKIMPGKTPYSTTFEHVSMEQLALQLGPPATSRPVVDKTGLHGSFDFKLDVALYILDPSTGQPVMDAKGSVDIEGATLRGLREQVGLDLKPERGAFNVLVVDHVAKTPSDN